MKYLVHNSVDVEFVHLVEAESKEHAQQIAREELESELRDHSDVDYYEIQSIGFVTRVRGRDDE